MFIMLQCNKVIVLLRPEEVWENCCVTVMHSGSLNMFFYNSSANVLETTRRSSSEDIIKCHPDTLLCSTELENKLTVHSGVIIYLPESLSP